MLIFVPDSGHVKIATSVNATIADSEGFGIIVNDDATAPLLFEEDAPSE